MANVVTSQSRHWFAGAIAAPLYAIVDWYKISQERAELQKLPADRLSDMGLTQREVEYELARPFWQVSRND